MPFNFQTFKTRALTALLFVAVMLVGLLWNFWSFVVLFTVIHFGCWYEFIKLLKKIYGSKYLPYCLGGVIYITLPVLMMLDWAREVTVIQNVNIPTSTIFDRIIPIGIIFSIWINDTMAYLVGSFIGRTPLSKISPKKTWEGTIGGVVLCVIVIGFLYPLVVSAATGINIRSSQWFIIPALCAIFGTIGDLFESKLKRMADVKDSGSFMPGHGGFLDRFDSLLFAVPAVWVYVYFFLG